jgi:hypothetical protein
MSAALILLQNQNSVHIGFNVFQYATALVQASPFGAYKRPSKKSKVFLVWSNHTATSPHFDTQVANRHATFHRCLRKHLLHIRQNNRYRLKLLIERLYSATSFGPTPLLNLPFTLMRIFFFGLIA